MEMDNYIKTISTSITDPYITTSKYEAIPIPNNVTIATKNYSFEDILSRLDELERKKKFVIDYTTLSCRNCGASLKQKVNDYIVKCPYCDTAYLIGTYQINDNGR